MVIAASVIPLLAILLAPILLIRFRLICASLPSRLVILGHEVHWSSVCIERIATKSLVGLLRLLQFDDPM
jgi:hypothetical protein